MVVTASLELWPPPRRAKGGKRTDGGVGPVRRRLGAWPRLALSPAPTATADGQRAAAAPRSDAWSMPQSTARAVAAT